MSVSRSSDRGQTEPLAALAAVFALGIALSLYTAGLGGALADASDRDRDVAAPALSSVAGELLGNGVVDPADLPEGLSASPEGYRMRITLTTDDRDWSAGPPAPPTAESATRRVSVQRWPGRVVPGHLRVEVWS